jgi:hypothetical protein
MLDVVHTVPVTLPVWETDMVGLKVAEVHPEIVPVEQALREFVTVMVPVSHTLCVGVVVTDGLKDTVTVPDPQALVEPLEVSESETDTVGESVPLKVEEDVWDTEVLKDPVTVEDKHKEGELLKDPVAVEDKHKVGEVLTEVVVDKDPVWVPEVQGVGVIVEVEQ